jgi:GNAT superfamily N-acetyltransferase
VNAVEISRVRAEDLHEPLHLLDEWLRDGEPVPDGFIQEIQANIEAGNLEVLAAHLENRTVGVLALAFRPSISLGGSFASIEDLYVIPEARKQGVARALLQAAEERCRHRDISYLEAQVERTENRDFYAASGYEPEPDVRVFSRSLPLHGNVAKGQ